nr:radical SAM protein [uncultured Lachnoclostridium sp.]
MKWSRYNMQWESDQDTIVTYNSLNHKILQGLKEDYRSIKSVEQLCLDGFLVKDQLDEVKLLKESLEFRNQDTNSLSCWVFVSNDCNLTCPYCWEQGGLLKKETNMSMENARKTVDWLIHRIVKSAAKELSLTFMGGEPLLNMEVIKQIAQQLNQKIPKVSYDIITNGVLLTPNVIEECMEINLHSYQITLDGTRNLHDSRRCFADGEGTFDVILKNIESLVTMDENVSLVIRMNIDMQNYKNIPILLRLLHRMEFHRFAALCINDTILKDSGQNSFILKEVIHILRLAKELGFQIAYGELNHCWMMSEAWFMINQDGLIYKCPSLVGEKEYAVGSIRDAEFNKEYQRQISLKPWDTCLSCELAGLCSGGCPNRDKIQEAQGQPKKVCRKQYLMELLKLKYEPEG